MGLFDDLFSSFTGSASREASEQSRQFLTGLYGQVGQQLGQAQGTGIGYLTSGREAALAGRAPYYPEARGDLLSALTESIRRQQDVAPQALGHIAGGVSQAIPRLEAGLSQAYIGTDPLRAAGTRATTEAARSAQLSADALGLNGPEGVARAQAAFQAGPGFQFALGQGLESVARNAAAAGMLASGNQLQEAQRYGTGLAQQEWDNYLRSVAGREQMYGGLEAQTARDLANILANANINITGKMADVYTAGGREAAEALLATHKAMSDYYNIYGGRLSELAAREGQAISDIYQRGGQSLADLVSNIARSQVGLASSIVSPSAQSFQTAAQAQEAGNRNLFDLLGNAISAIF